jgi:hypothetical protein
MSIDGGSWIVTQGTVGVDTENFYVYDGNNYKSVFLDGDAAGPGLLIPDSEHGDRPDLHNKLLG